MVFITCHRATSFVVFFIVLQLGFISLLKAQPGISTPLSDSLFHELQQARGDTSQLNSLFTAICQNRRSLGNEYTALLEQFIFVADDHDYSIGKMRALDRLGLQKRYDEEYDIAIQYHLQSMELAEELQDSVQLCYNLNNLGQAYRKQDLYALALKYFHHAMVVQEAIGDTRGAYFTQNTLGATYFVMEDYDRAYEYFKVALKAAEFNDDKRSMSFNLGSLGEVYLVRNQYDSAMVCFERAKVLKIEANYDRGFAVTEHLIGQAWYAMGEHAKARRAFDEALKMHTEHGNQRYQALCFAFLGKVAIKEKEFDKAFTYLTQARDLAIELHSLENLMLIEESFVELYRESHDYENALAALNLQNQYRFQINEVKSEKNIQTLEIEYQTRQKEQEIELLYSENQIKSHQVQLSIVFIALLFLGAFSIYLYSYMQKRHAHLVEVGLQHKLSRAQMNPHFVSNAMASIQKYIHNNDAQMANKYLEKFSLLNRSVLEHSLVDSISLSEEISMITGYLEFEQLRLGHAFSFVIEKDDDLDTEMIYIPPLFIQPFLENAVKHGLKDMKGQGRLTLRFTDMENMLKIEVLDNGKGLQKAEIMAETVKSRSLEIVKKRLLLLRKKYRKLPDLSLDSRAGNGETGVHVCIHLPII